MLYRFTLQWILKGSEAMNTQKGQEPFHLNNNLISNKTFRIPLMPREKASLIILRRKGYSINILSKAFSRSPSVIHRILKRAYGYGLLRRLDMRKFPNSIRLKHGLYSWKKLMSLWSRWVTFMLSEEGEPP